MKKACCLAIGLCCFAGAVEAQKVDDDLLIDSIKACITQFFITEGLLDEQKVKKSRDYIYATEINQKRLIGYNTSGIYRIGVYQSQKKSSVLITTINSKPHE
jgi:hypothetical protein